MFHAPQLSRPSLWLLAAIGLLTACPPPSGGDGGPGDGGVFDGSAPDDAGPPVDAAAPDDAGAPPDDAGTGDAGTRDAGTDDAGSGDAGSGDAGPGDEDGGPLPEPTGPFTQHSAGGLSYRLYRPSYDDGSAALPLVLMLHGCSQDSSAFATATRMNAHAEAEGFVVAWPDQPSSANVQRCWNWFSPSHQVRGAGEPAALVDVVDDVKARANIDDARVYVAGLSSGAAMSVILAATYPDVFDKAAVVAGLEYKAATNSTSAFTAMSSGGPSPTTAGRDAYAAMGAHARVVPVLVIHGTSDFTVRPVNGEQVISQWAVTNDLAKNGAEDGDVDDEADETAPGQVPGGYSYTVSRYHDDEGALVLQKVDVEGMGHAWPGGPAGGSFTDPGGPDASGMAWSFFSAP